MKVLLTGLIDAFVLDMLQPLQREGCQLFLMGEWDPGTGHDLTYYPMEPSSKEALRIMEAARFDAIVFFFSYQCEAMTADNSAKGMMLDALLAMQTAAQTCGVSTFALVTDSRVFGAGQRGVEDEMPIPDTPTGVLIKAAEDCFTHSITSPLRRLLIRVTSLYAPQWEHSLFTQATLLSQSKSELTLPGDKRTPCDFIRAADVASFIALALDSELEGIAHLTYGVPQTYQNLATRLTDALQGLTIRYTGEPKQYPLLKDGLAGNVGWIPRHFWQTELDELLVPPAAKVKRGLFHRAHKRVSGAFGRALPYIEIVVFALIAYGLTLLTGHDAVFHYLNFMLLYTVVIGNMHGSMPGLIAALISCGVYAISWAAEGNDFYLLLYNIDNWLPLATYLVGGSVFGYLHDKRQEQLEAISREKEAQDEETRFLETIYTQAAEDRDRLQQQVLRSRDSYGRIYAITRELDSLQPEQIFLSTLNIMENVLQNHSVAIYYYKVNFGFARLVLYSSNMQKPANSLELSGVPLLRESIDDVKVFANHELLPGYPSLAAPIAQNNETMAMIVLWDVPFDQATLYYQNLFSITCGLVQSAMLRALQYFRLSPDVYVADTHLLSEKPFLAALSAYRDMQAHHRGCFLLLRIQASGSLSIEEYDRRIGIATRSTDLAGRMDSGSYYVILPQADEENLVRITARFASQQLHCEIVPQECEQLD